MSEAANGPTTYIVISIIRCHMVSYGVIITAHESSMMNPESYNCALAIATVHCCKDCALLHMSQIYHCSHVNCRLTVIIEFDTYYRVKTELELY
jgi:hypothetical protein